MSITRIQVLLSVEIRSLAIEHRRLSFRAHALVHDVELSTRLKDPRFGPVVEALESELRELTPQLKDVRRRLNALCSVFPFEQGGELRLLGDSPYEGARAYRAERLKQLEKFKYKTPQEEVEFTLLQAELEHEELLMSIRRMRIARNRR